MKGNENPGAYPLNHWAGSFSHSHFSPLLFSSPPPLNPFEFSRARVCILTKLLRFFKRILPLELLTSTGVYTSLHRYLKISMYCCNSVVLIVFIWWLLVNTLSHFPIHSNLNLVQQMFAYLSDIWVAIRVNLGWLPKSFSRPLSASTKKMRRVRSHLPGLLSFIIKRKEKDGIKKYLGSQEEVTE